MSQRKKLRKYKQMQKERGRNMSNINNGKDIEKVAEETGDGNKKLDDDDDDEILESEREALNQFMKQQQEVHKTDFPEIEVIKIEDESENESEIEKIDLTNANVPQHNQHLIFTELKSPAFRGIFPSDAKRIQKFSALVLYHFKRCLEEHSYSFIDKPGFIPLTSYGNIKVTTLLNNNSKSTVVFPNRIERNENRTEQQTLAQKDSITKHVVRNSNVNLSNNNISSRKGITLKNSSSGSDNSDVNQSSPSLRYSLRSWGRKSSSQKNVDNGMTSGGGGGENSTEGSKIVSDSVKSNCKTGVVSLDDIAKEISEMEKMIQSKCDVSCDNKNPESVNNKSEVQPPKFQKIRNKDDQPKKDGGEYILPMPNLTKMVPEDKNWNLEYVEDDVKNLGLDDLLLKASELNAENFTKALGQNTTGGNGSKGDSPEIVLTFPKPRRGEDVSSKESESAKTVTPKRAKLDFYKKYVRDDKVITPEEDVKTPPVASPKRLGIKVKTVQNINEEFKDSLGAKLKNLETDSTMTKPIYNVSDDVPKESQEEVVNTRSSILSRKKLVEQGKTTAENDGETRPFVMTIIQNKEDTTGNDRLPRVLSPKVFTRPKLVSDNGFEERQKDTDNVTLVVSEPRNSRPFEVVNVEDYIPNPNCYQQKKNSLNYVVHYRNGTFTRKRDVDGKLLQPTNLETSAKKKNIPFILNNTKKFFRMANGERTLVTTVEEPSKRIMCPTRPVKRLMKSSTETVPPKVASEEQKDSGAKPEESIPSIPENPSTETATSQKSQLISLTAFSNILKEILPDKWILSLNKRYGLQILKTHLDEFLNPSIMISVVIGRTGKITVNVRGRQLEKSHELFSNMCNMANSNDKVSINYILSLINKLKFFSVCFGCDDLSLKKYWCEDGFIEYYTEFQQTYRSHICESLVRLGKRRCYPCQRMHESLKKRKRREILGKKDGETAKPSESAQNETEKAKVPKKNYEEFIEESFNNMRQMITDEIEKTREDEECEKMPKTQDEVLGFMGLTRKDNIDVNLRKSKRGRRGFKKCESVIRNNVNKEELYFLEKYWTDINVLFSTSLLIGAYSRTSTPRLREKCRMFHKLLSTWRGIVRDNPDWVGGNINLAENLVDDEDDAAKCDATAKEKFEKMDIPALRAYIINCVKEVNKIKIRLRTKNAYFRVLYNTFVKPRMKKARQSTSDDGGKPCNSANTTSTEMDSSEGEKEDGGDVAPSTGD